MTIQDQADLFRLRQQLERSEAARKQAEAENRALREICSFLCSPFRTKFDRLTSRDFYGRLYGTTDGCLLCGAEATKDERGVKSYIDKSDCALVVLGYVEEGEVIIVDW